MKILIYTILIFLAATRITASEPAAAPTNLITGEPGKGITLTNATNTLSTNIRARIQLRYSEHIINDTNSREVQPRTVRLFWSGHAFTPDFRYTVQLAFGARDFEAASQNPDPNSPLFDAFFEWTRWRDAKITAGQFFGPFSRLRTMREFALHFIDRQALIRPLTLDRDVGLQIASEDFLGLNQWLGYEIGFFGGRGRNRFQSAASTGAAAPAGGLIAARVYVTPFASFDQNIEGDITHSDKLRLLVSTGAAVNFNSDRLYSTNGTLTTRTVGSTTNQSAYTDYYNYVADIVVKWQGMSLELEYIWKKAKGDVIGFSDVAQSVPIYSQSGRGAIVQFGVHPFPRDWPQIEFVGRYARLFSDSPNLALTQLAQQQRNILIFTPCFRDKTCRSL